LLLVLATRGYIVTYQAARQMVTRSRSTRPVMTGGTAEEHAKSNAREKKYVAGEGGMVKMAGEVAVANRADAARRRCRHRGTGRYEVISGRRIPQAECHARNI